MAARNANYNECVAAVTSAVTALQITVPAWSINYNADPTNECDGDGWGAVPIGCSHPVLL